ncbi:MAG: hypothetical protein HONBIEJF_01836 [Fimbriimonadaceae bacterium]|nr:hypothetical protein [Fimbriimonadaceae bacterium]
MRIAWLLLTLCAFSVAPAQDSEATVKLNRLLQDWSESAGTTAVCVDAIANIQVKRPESAPKTPEMLEKQLVGIVAQTGQPVQIIKIMLPPPPAGRKWNAAELLHFVRAQQALVRRPLPEVNDETVVVLGAEFYKQEFTKANNLGLKPVYVLALRYANFGGIWDTTYGEMRITQRGTKVTGTYTSGDGVIEGEVVGDELRVRWYERGNQSGGYASYKISDDGNSFSGPWNYDTDPERQAGTWNGRRQGTGKLQRGPGQSLQLGGQLLQLDGNLAIEQLELIEAIRKKKDGGG